MKKGLKLTGFLFLMVLSLSATATETGPKLLGDESDGSRTTPIHLIPLYAEDEEGQKGEQIKPDAEFPMPFSTRWTCMECHNYDLVKLGWHFNAVDSNVPYGRPGQPWVYFDSKLCIQIPLSYRQWPGTYRPDELGLSGYRFTKIFGRHMPGGGPGEVEATDIDDIGRQLVSGKLEINCFACHNAHYGQDMGSTVGYAVQVARENFRWAATASCEFASVSGSAAEVPFTYDPFMPDPSEEKAPRVSYDDGAFNENNEVLLDLVREVPNDRCYFCHSNLYYDNSDQQTEKWMQDEDVHLQAGLKCIDCHRNGIEHNIIRGYAEEADVVNNPLAAVSTCEGCHLPVDDEIPQAGRLGAPVPTHPGIPTVHFDRLTCTACHSGPWPDKQTVLTKTSRAHKLGTPNANKSKEGLPHIYTPVFARQEPIGAAYLGQLLIKTDEKIAPHKLIWPVFWGILEDEHIKPIEISVVEKVVGMVFADIELSAEGNWPNLTNENVTQALEALSAAVNGKAVYVTGGKVLELNDEGRIIEQENHPEAQPCKWPLAHNVRPAAQSLGIRYCTDCHATDSPFFFGDVTVDSSIVTGADSARKMAEFMNVRPFYTKAFAFSFVFRPWMKVISLAASALLAVVLLLYGLKALTCVVKTFSGGGK